MPVTVDMHTHCFPDALAKRAVLSLARKADIPAFTGATVSELRSSMRQAGIDVSVLQPIATKPQQTQGINTWALSAQGDGILSFGTIHPGFEHYGDEIRRLAQNGIKGVKFHPEYQDFFVDDERIFPLYDALFSAGMIILFHAGEDPGFPGQCHCTPQRLKTLSSHFPGGVMIAAHMGGYRKWPDVVNALGGSGVYLDTSFSFSGLGKSGMQKLIRSYGADKILFATDSPWAEQKKETGNIRSLALGSRELDAIMGGNAARLLGL